METDRTFDTSNGLPHYLPTGELASMVHVVNPDDWKPILGKHGYPVGWVTASYREQHPQTRA